MLPPNPRPGEAFDVYAVGIFPTPGYVFTRKDLSVGESEPETLIAALQIEAPVGGQPEVEEPFREWIGTQTLDEGKYPVHAIVNNIMMYRATLTVGGDESPPNSEWITFQRSGGFTGWVQNLTVDMDRSALITSDSVIEANNRSGLVPQESFDRLSEIMETIDFSVLDSYYPKEVPIADGYVYEITVNRDQALLVEQGAMAPPEVADLVSVLERILDGRIDLDRRLDSESSVSNWSMY